MEEEEEEFIAPFMKPNVDVTNMFPWGAALQEQKMEALKKRYAPSEDMTFESFEAFESFAVANGDAFINHLGAETYHETKGSHNFMGKSGDATVIAKWGLEDDEQHRTGFVPRDRFIEIIRPPGDAGEAQNFLSPNDPHTKRRDFTWEKSPIHKACGQHDQRRYHGTRDLDWCKNQCIEEPDCQQIFRGAGSGPNPCWTCPCAASGCTFTDHTHYYWTYTMTWPDMRTRPTRSEADNGFKQSMPETPEE